MEKGEKATKDRIQEIAASEFLNKGYHDASLRNIVREAGVTTGSFYWYYSSKEELFDDLVGAQYDHILKMYDDALDDFWKMPAEDQEKYMEEISGGCMIQMVEYIYNNLTAFKLLLTASSGTKYDHLIHELTRREIESTHEFEKHMAEIGIEMGTEVEPELKHSIVSGMFSSMFEFVIHNASKEKTEKMIHHLHLFYTAGWRALMETQ